jgi:hypothetical protein
LECEEGRELRRLRRIRHRRVAEETGFDDLEKRRDGLERLVREV